MITLSEVITQVRQQSADIVVSAIDGNNRWSDSELNRFVYNSVQRLLSDRTDMFLQNDGTISSYALDGLNIDVSPFGDKPIVDYTLYQMYASGTSDQVDQQNAIGYFNAYNAGVAR